MFVDINLEISDKHFRHMPKFILYKPYSEFMNVHEQKAPGQIPVGFMDAGFDSGLIVGVLKSHSYEKTGVRIFETGKFTHDTIITATSSKNLFVRTLKNFFDFSEYKKVIKILKNDRPDIFISYTRFPITWIIGISYRIWAFFHGYTTKLIVKLDSDGTYRSSMGALTKIIDGLSYFSLSLIFSRIITESTCGYEVFSKIPQVKNKLRVVPNSISNNFIQKNVSTERSRTIITVARVVEIKGIDILIDVFHKVHLNHPEWLLEIIGSIENLEYLKILQDRIAKYDLSDVVKFLGEIYGTELINKYTTSSIFCLFSKCESFALSRLEALSMGMLVISSDAGCAKDFIKYGLQIVDINNIEETVHVLRNAIELVESGTFKPSTNQHIPSYKELAINIASNDF